jgi:hypothetical protein
MSSKKIQRTLVIPIALVCLVAGCQILKARPSVIDGLVCAPPCWQNITPGETTEQEALKIVSALPLIDTESIQNLPPAQDIHSVYSRAIYAFFLPDDPSQTHLFIGIINNRVADIFLDGYWDLTLEKTFEKLGEPQYVLVANYGTEFAIGFIIPPKGIAFGYTTVGRPGWQRTKISSKITIEYIDFFDPNTYQQFLDSRTLTYGDLSGKEISERLVPWVGYGDIQEKYPPK